MQFATIFALLFAATAAYAAPQPDVLGNLLGTVAGGNSPVSGVLEGLTGQGSSGGGLVQGLTGENSLLGGLLGELPAGGLLEALGGAAGASDTQGLQNMAGTLANVVRAVANLLDGGLAPPSVGVPELPVDVSELPVDVGGVVGGLTGR